MGQLAQATPTRREPGRAAMARIARLYLLLLVLLAGLGVARDAIAAEPLKGLALVIGQSEYEHLDALENPVNDARRIEKLLDDLGFVTTDAVNRDGRRLRRDLDRFVQDVEYDKADVALIYYSGHAIEAGGVNYLVPVDGDVASLEAAETSLVPLREIFRQLQKKARITIVLLDACRTNPFPEGALLKTDAASEGARITPSGLAAPKGSFTLSNETSDSLGVVIGFAAEPGRVAFDGADGLATSPYAAALLRHFAAPGVGFGDVMTMVTEEVYLKTKKRQRPWTNASLRRLLYFGGSGEAQTGDETRLNEARRDLLLTISATPEATRRFVEALADQDDLPLDLLYGILKELEVDTAQGPSRLQEQLRIGAENLKRFKAERAVPVRKDPELIRLSGLADRAESEGLIPLARDYRARASDRAEELVPALRERKESLKSDFLQVAATYAQEAETAILGFDYTTAIRQFDAAYKQAWEWDETVAAHYRLRLGETYKIVGKTARALTTYRDHLATFERLARSDPNNAELQRELTVSYSKIGDILVAQNNLEDALESYISALTIAQSLVRSDLGDALSQRELAASHFRVGEVQVAQGNLEDALESYTASLAIFKRLVQSDPNNTQWQRELSASYGRVGNALVALGNLEDALENYTAALANSKLLVRSDNGNSLSQQELGWSHVSVGNVQLKQGNLKAARENYKASLDIVKRLLRADFGNSLLRRQLAVSHVRVGDVLVKQGNLEAALESYFAARTIFERLARLDLNNSEWQRDLSVAHERVGDIRAEQGDLTQALESYATSLAIREQLALSEPSNAEHQSGLSTAHSKVGDIETLRGNLKIALESHKASLAISRRLTRLDSTNANWQRDLSVSYIKVGDLEDSLGNSETALENYKASLSIFKHLTHVDPSNSGWQRDLSVSYIRAGSFHAKQNNLEAAIDNFEAALAIRERLARSEPDNAEWLRDLSLSHIKVGQLLARQGNDEGARERYETALTISARLARSNPKNESWQGDLAQRHSTLASLYMRGDNHELARMHLEVGRRTVVRLLERSPDHPLWLQYLEWFDEKLVELEE